MNLSHAPVIKMTGGDVTDLLQRISTNDMLPLNDGKDVCTVFTTEKGRIAEVAHVVPMPEHGEFVLFLFGAYEGDFREWLERYVIMEDVSLPLETLAPSQWIVYTQDFTRPVDIGKNVEDLRQNGFFVAEESVRGRFLLRIADPQNADRPGVVVSRLAGASTAPSGHFDACRIRSGVPMAGKELGESFNPMEALLREYISFTKGCYVGQEVIARLDSYKKVSRILTRVRGTGAANPGPIRAGDREAGTLTSFCRDEGETWSGLAYVRTQSLNARDLTLAEAASPLTVLDPSGLDQVYGSAS